MPLGYTRVTEEEHSSMRMDFSLIHLKEGEHQRIHHQEKESALLLVEGNITFRWEEQQRQVTRLSCFKEGPWALHVCRGNTIDIQAHADSECVLLQAGNRKEFTSVFYTPDDCHTQTFGKNQWEGVAERVVTEIFSARNAPYSQLVMGEAITPQGRWSSYPPHYHEQPEIYYFRFSKPQGFGFARAGDKVFSSQHNASLLIDGNLVHPQAAAPGYAMYYCWMIRNLGDTVWDGRITAREHQWLEQPEGPKEDAV